MYRRVLLLIMAVILPASALMAVFPQIAAADGTPAPYFAPAVLDAAKKSTERNSIAMCLGYQEGASVRDSNYGSDIDPKVIASGSWFSGYTSVRQWSDYNNGDNGTGCDKVNAGASLQDLGFTSGNIQAACGLAIFRQNGSDCVNGTGNMEYKGKGKQDLLNNIDKVYKGTQFGKEYSAEQFYVMAMSVIMSDKACKASPIALGSTASADQKAQADATITVVGPDGVATAVLYKFNGNKGTSWSFRNDIGGGTAYVSDKCSELAGVANQNANAYAKWVSANQPGSPGNPGTCEQYASLQIGTPVTAQSASQKTQYSKLLTACNDGLANKTTPDYCKKYAAADENAACIYGFGTALASTPSGDTTDTPTAGDKPTCGIQGIGWLVCPAMTFMAKIADESYSFLASNFLSVNTNLITQSQSTWAKFRDIANVIFVIVLILIIYSQITGIGMTNNSLKRKLPRLLAFAVLVNMSNYICLGVVDLSNFTGYASAQFFNGLTIGGGTTDGGALASVGSGITWAGAVGAVLVAGVGVALAISVPVLLAAGLAIALIVLILVGREAGIVILTDIAPVAIALGLLPNLEQVPKKWWKAMFALCVVFPEVGILFGATHMTAVIIANTGGSSGQDITQFVALGVSAIPLIAVGPILKGSLSGLSAIGLGAVGAKLQGAANKASGKVGSQVKSTSRLGAAMADMKQFRGQQRQIRLAKGRGSSRSALGVVGRVVGGKKYNERARLHAEGLENKEYEEDVKAATEYQARHTTFDQKMRLATGQPAEDGGAEPTETERDAAVRFMMSSGNFTERQQVLASVGSMTGGLRRSAINGARAKGDTGVYGSSTLGRLEDTSGATPGSATGQDVDAVRAILDQGTTNRINTGDLAPETFTRDAYTAGYVAQQVQNAEEGAKTQLAQSLTNYAASDQGKKTAASLQSHIDTVVNTAPAGTVQPASATPIAPAGQVQGQATLTIPHGGNGAPPPSGMTQQSSGLFVPSNMNNGGTTPPSPPPAP